MPIQYTHDSHNGAAKRRNEMATFEMNGKAYSTDQATLELLREIVTAAKAADDFSAVIAVMALGAKSGRIIEL